MKTIHITITQIIKNIKDKYYNHVHIQCQHLKKYIIYSLSIIQNISSCKRRYYGQPKLTKPKELKGIKSIGKATFIPKHCEPQVYVKNNDVYIKHTDYFSYLWRPLEGERIDMQLSYYMEKYFNKTKKEKFVYPDTFGSIILRNEAWIMLKDTLPLILTENNTLIANKIFELQKKDKYTPYDIDDNEWIRFLENVCKCVKENYKK